jgi:hypothetical protein
VSEPHPTPLAAWLNEWQVLTGEAGRIAARLHELAALVPASADAGDATRLLAFREMHGLDGPSAKPQDLASVAEGAARPFDSLLWQAKSTLSAMLERGEAALVRLSREGIGAVNGRDLPPGSWFHFTYSGREMIGVRLSGLPPTHCLYAVPARYSGGAVILGPGEFAGEGPFGSRVVRPRLFYGLSDCAKWTIACESQRLKDEADEAAVSEALQRRARAEQDAQDRRDPQKRFELLERELAELKAR